MLTSEQLNELLKNGSDFRTDAVQVIDAMADRIKMLETRVKMLEAREPAKTTLRVVNDE